MKKWLDKTWAKITAFILLIVFTVLAIAGGAGIAYLVSEDVYLDGGEQLQRDLYWRLCDEELLQAEYDLWVMTGGTIISDRVAMMDATVDNSAPLDLTSPELADSFRRNYDGSACSLTLRRADGTVLMQNYEPDEKALCLLEDALYDGRAHDQAQTPDYILTAALRSDYHGDSYEQRLATLGVRARYALIVLEVLFVAAWLLCLCFTLASAGHWQGHEGIHLTWFDRIPADLWMTGLVIVFLLTMDLSFWEAAAVLAIGVLLLYLFLPVFTAQCKAGTVLKGSVIAWVLRLLWRVLRSLGYVLGNVPLVWKTALAVAALLAFDVFCVANHWDEEYLVVLLAVNLLAGLFLLYLAIGLRTLQKGGQALADGSYESVVDTKYLFGDFRRHGENLNAIQQGVQKAVEQQMRSERMKTELITNVSHDIKTPLTSIVNYVDLLKKEEIDNPAAREYIDVLERQSGRLRKLTEDLVEASKAAAGSIPVTLTDTDVNVFLSQVAGEYGQRLAENSIEPVLTLDETEPHILADGKLLWRVLDNLLGNVCKYAMPGTRVYLSSETVGRQVCITAKNVSRYPLNISADELTERFVRGDASRSTEGSGLGLSIAMGLTHLQKGQFRLSVDGDLFKARLAFDRL